MSDTPSSEPREIGASLSLRFALVVVGLYALLVFLPFLGNRILTRHEVMITQPALNMVNHDHWVVPHFMGEIWVAKPPLASWVTAGLFEAFGFGEFLARLPAALSAVGLCLLVTLLASRKLTPMGALFAGLVQATCVYAYMQGRLGEIDFPFAFIIAAANGVLFWHWADGEIKLPLRAAAAFHVLLGLAVLAKGPLGVALVGAGLLFFCWQRRSLQPLWRVVLTPAAPLSILVAGSWYVAAYMQAGDEAMNRWFYGYLSRAAGLHHLGSQPPWLYLLAIPWLMMPWTIVFVLGWKKLRTAFAVERRPDEVYLWSWFLGGLILLSLMAFKHKHYCIPILPPLSILAGRLLAEHTVWKGRFARDFFIGTFAVIAIIFLVVGGVVMPKRDHRVETMAFVRETVAKLPPEASLHLVGLGQAAVYPYIEHPVSHVLLRPPSRGEEPDIGPLRAVLEQAGPEGVWILTYRKHLAWAGEKLGWQVEELGAERARKKHPEPETLVIGRARLVPPDPAVGAVTD